MSVSGFPAAITSGDCEGTLVNGVEYGGLVAGRNDWRVGVANSESIFKNNFNQSGSEDILGPTHEEHGPRAFPKGMLGESGQVVCHAKRPYGPCIRRCTISVICDTV